MTDVIVTCGNGGDWEWMNDKHYWELWIKQNITETGFSTGFSDECKADELLIRFDNPHYATLFSLKRPIYIRYEDIMSKPIDTR